jgi:hypothetical protein
MEVLGLLQVLAEHLPLEPEAGVARDVMLQALAALGEAVTEQLTLELTAHLEV